MERSGMLMLFLIISLMLAACSSSAPGDDSAEVGKKVFDTGGDVGVPCSSCHTLDGSPLVGPSLQGIGQQAGERVSGMSAEDYIRESIIDPSVYIVDGYTDSMNKDYGENLRRKDIDALVEFLLSQ